MNAIQFLQDQNILKPGNTEWIVKFSDGREVNICDLMEGYAEYYKSQRITQLANHLQAKAKSEILFQALKTLTFMARTSGGTAGPDSGLMEACENAENVLNMVSEGSAGILTANNLPTPEQADISPQEIADFLASLSPAQWREKSGLPPYTPADLDDF